MHSSNKPKTWLNMFGMLSWLSSKLKWCSRINRAGVWFYFCDFVKSKQKLSTFYFMKTQDKKKQIQQQQRHHGKEHLVLHFDPLHFICALFQSLKLWRSAQQNNCIHFSTLFFHNDEFFNSDNSVVLLYAMSRFTSTFFFFYPLDPTQYYRAL